MPPRPIAAAGLVFSVDGPDPRFPHPFTFQQTRRCLVKKFGLTLVGLFLVGMLVQSAHARPDYKKVADTTSKDTKLAPVVEELKCNLCHVDKEEKKVRNDYGQALVKCGLSEEKYKELKADKEKLADYIKEVMKKAEGEKSVTGATFGDLIKAGKAPGTPPKK
jgi:hypothetical protein